MEDINSILSSISLCLKVTSKWLEIMEHAIAMSSKTKTKGLKYIKVTHGYCPWRIRTHHWFYWTGYWEPI